MTSTGTAVETTVVTAARELSSSFMGRIKATRLMIIKATWPRATDDSEPSEQKLTLQGKQRKAIKEI